MLVTKRSRLQIRVQNVTFVILFLAAIGLVAYLSVQYSFETDWTASGRNTLSQASKELLDVVDVPVTITAYASEDEQLRRQITLLVNRYQRAKPNLTLEFVNPETHPKETRELGITQNGELIVQVEERTEHVTQLNEQTLSNAIQRLVRSGERWLVFLAGHGERDPHGQANHDLSAWTQQLEKTGIKTQSINLADTPSIPQNTTALVIAGPQVPLLKGEVELIMDYVEDGGNLLWLSDPGPLYGLRPLAEKLGIEFQPGVIVDPTTQLFGIEDPRFAVVAEYPLHAITQDFNKVTLFPQSVALDMQAPEQWDGATFLETVPRSWSETSELEGDLTYDAGQDVPGPLTLGVAVKRDLSLMPGADNKAEVDPSETPTQSEDAGQGAEPSLDPETGQDQERLEQRVVVVGDGDFASNAFLGNAGNLELGLNIVNWLGRDEDLIAIPPKLATDTNLELSTTAQYLIGFGFLLALPVILIGSGLYIWYSRRKR